MACRKTCFIIMDLVWYVGCNCWWVSIRVQVGSWIWGREVMLKVVNYLMIFFCIGFLMSG